MDYVTTILVAVLGSGIINIVLTRIFTKRDKRKGENTGFRKALRLIMKDRLRWLCVKYIQQNWIYEDELEDLISMHECYHNELKGNGYLNDLMERVKHLEIRGIGVK